MGKVNKRSKSGGNGSGGWSHEQHEARVSRKVAKLENEQKKNDNDNNNNDDDDHDDAGGGKYTKRKRKGYERSMLLAHDSYEKKQESKLKLHITKGKREIEALRRRLKAWDEVAEQAAYRKQLEMEEKKRLELATSAESNGPKPKKRNKRLGPETWKLRGAARPAYEVYDFDTRYVDPHLKAHEEAKAKAKRVINVFHYCKGHFGKPFEDDNDDDDTPRKKVSQLLVDTCRKFLSISMQVALLNLDGKKYKSAREHLLEIIELEGTSSLHPITNARCRLMRMYIEANRPDSARRLWEKLPENYSSVWIRYSAALLEFVSWKVLGEEGSTEETATTLLTKAIRSNVFCAYYIAFYGTFEKVMEYTEDVEDALDGSLEQAIEYFSSEQMGSWVGTEGAIEWIRTTIVDALSHNGEEDTKELNSHDLEWEQKLSDTEKDHENFVADDEEDEPIEDKNDETVEPDVLMFAGMFRVGMDMLSDSGDFLKNSQN